MNNRTVVIAEAGVNHNGNIDIAKKLIDVAVNVGADLVKFQTFFTEDLVTKNAEKADYQISNNNLSTSQFDLLKGLELSKKDHRDLYNYARDKGIVFLSTGFDVKSIKFLVELGIDRIKIPSGEITNFPYLKHVASLGLPIIMSTGMAALGEIESALNLLIASGAKREDITILHCNTQYPTPVHEVNLLAMQTLRESFKTQVGFSDHTEGIEMAIAAVALGAKVIEKHYTLDRNMPGPDHKASLEPHELEAMVNGIRNIELALGDGVKTPNATEIMNRVAIRKSIVAAQSIKKGEVFTPTNLGVKRPGNGISPMRWEEILGKQAKRNFKIDEIIEL